jgi:hypothetical protein
MSDSQLSALLAPFLALVFGGIVALIARAILRRMPEGKLKRILSWPPEASSKEDQPPRQ